MMALKKGPVATVEKDLIVEVDWHADALVTAEKPTDAGMEAVSNAATVSGNNTTFS